MATNGNMSRPCAVIHDMYEYEIHAYMPHVRLLFSGGSVGLTFSFLLNFFSGGYPYAWLLCGGRLT